MNEEFAIKLKTILDMSSLQEVKNQLQQFQQTAQGTMETAVSPAKTAGKTFDTENAEEAKDHYWEIQQILTQIADLQVTLSASDVLGLSSQEIIDINVQIEKLQNKLIALQKGGSGSLKVVQNTTVKIQNDLKGAVKQASRFVLALVGVRGIYGSIRKAMSAYLAQNEELQAKLNGAWYALGSLFAPVLEKIINMFVYLVSLVDALAKSLGFAGMNMAKYGKAGAKASKQLAGFDELNNVSNQGGSGVGPFSLTPISDEDLNKFKSLLALIGAIGAGLASWKIAEGIASLFGKTLDPSRLLGISLAVGGVVMAVWSLLNYLKDPSWLNFGGIILGVGTALAGVGLIIGNIPLVIAGAVTAVLGILAMFWPQINNFFKKVEQTLENWGKWINEHLTTNGTIWGAILGSFIESFLANISRFLETIRAWLDGTFNGIRSVLDGIIMIFRGNFAEGIKSILKGLIQFFSTQFETFKSLVTNTFNALLDLLKRLFVNIGSLFSEKVKAIINNYIIDPINKVIRWINDKLHFSYSGLRILGKEVIPSFNVRLANLGTIPKLAVGTNYVPNDMIAQIHEGEAVIPKEFNSEEYFNNDETNSLLERLIDVVESKEFRAYISQSEVGKAATKYINQQSRIMGGSII